jgi:acetyltransferase
MGMRARAAGPFRLHDGRVIWLRRVRADDASRLIELVRRLSPTSRQRRFLRDTLSCDRAEAERLANVDQVQQVAFAAVPDPNAPGPILAVGRFHGDGSARAELALLVEDAYQHVGLGRLLLKRLIGEAARRRLHVLDGYILHDNGPILRLLRSSGLPLEVDWYSGNVLSIKLHVRKPAA